MESFIFTFSLSPVRKEPDDRSEMISQLILGDEYTVIESLDDKPWIRIKTLHDNYEGWIDPKIHHPETSNWLKENPDNTISFQHSSSASTAYNGRMICSYLGSRFLTAHNSLFDLLQVDRQPVDRNPVKIASKFLGTPYLWGGRSITGIDCSGLTQQVFRMCDINIPRDAYQQAEIGEEVQFKNRKSGDLAFFDKNGGKIIHVGILDKNLDIIHAHGFVRTSRLTEGGILTDDESGFTHNLALIRRH